MAKRFKAAIIGGSGYGGAELARRLLGIAPPSPRHAVRETAAAGAPIESTPIREGGP